MIGKGKGIPMRHWRVDSRFTASTFAVACAGVVGVASALAQEPAATRLYRFNQAGREVGRETYRSADGRIERSVTIPLLALKLDSRATYAAGRFVRFEAEAWNAAGDTLRGRYTAEMRGDSLVVTAGRGTMQTRALALRPDAVAPTQTVSLIAELASRSAGRDTAFGILPMGAESLIVATVRHAGDTAVVTMVGLTARLLPDGAISIPAQQMTAAVWNGRDSLPPLPGINRPAPDYSAPPGAPYTAEEVRIPVRTASGDTFTLAGTLTRPVGVVRAVPVVVTLSGSGQQNRDEELWPLLTRYRPFRQVAERLARAGIAVLRYDDRGIGGSGGSLGTTADYAEDVVQIAAWLRTRPDVDARRVALLGHSEGAAIGPLAAVADPRIAAVVMMAGPGKPGRDILRDQFTRPVLVAPGLADSTRQRLLAEVPRQLDEYAAANAWTRWFDVWDPLPTARRLRVPVLILQGALDRQISVGQADTLAAAMRAAGNRGVTVRIYPRLNHLFLPTDGDGSPSEYPGLRQQEVPAEVLDDIAVWLGRVLRR